MSDAYATDTVRPAFARGDVLLVTNLTGLGIGHDGLDGGGDSVLRVLGAVDLGDGWRLTVEPYTGEESDDPPEPAEAEPVDGRRDVVDLMAALEESLQQARRGREGDADGS